MQLEKRLSLLIAGLITAVTTSAVVLAPVAVLSVDDTNASGFPGDPGISVPVTLSSQGGAQVAIVNFDLNYDFTQVSVANITIGLAASSAGKTMQVSYPPPGGIVRVLIFEFPPTPPPVPFPTPTPTPVPLKVIGDGQLAIVTFNVQGGALPGMSGLTLSNVTVGDPDVNAVPFSVNNGTFTVLAPPTATFTPTNAPTSTNTPIPTDTPVPPTATNSPTPGPSPTPTITLTPSITPTPSNTSPPTATHTPGPSPTASSTSSGTSTPGPSATASLTKLPTITQSVTSAGAGEGLELEGIAAATGTALAKFEGAVAATSTALAEEVAARPTDEIIDPETSSGVIQRPELFIAAGLLLLAIVLGGGAGYLAWRQQQE